MNEELGFSNLAIVARSFISCTLIPMTRSQCERQEMHGRQRVVASSPMGTPFAGMCQTGDAMYFGEGHRVHGIGEERDRGSP